MADRFTVNQKVQVGAESTSALGTPVAASKLLECFDWTLGISADVVYFTPTGRKYASASAENMEWMDGSLSGWLDYNGLIYVLGGAYGAVSAVAHGSSATAKDWVYSPPVTGSLTPQTLTIQQGDSVRAHQTSYGLFTSFGYKINRKDATCDAKFIGQPISDGITMSPSQQQSH